VRAKRYRVAHKREVGLAGRVVGGVGGIVLVLGLWQVLSDQGVVNPYFWSSPRAVWSAFLDLMHQGVLGPACWQSFKLFAMGFAIAAVSGIGIGVVLGWYRRPRAVLDPWISMLYAAPRIGIVPIIIIGFGIGAKSQVIIVWLAGVFPIVINTAIGVDAIDRDYLRVSQSYLAKNRDILWGVAIPNSLPLVFAGLRQGLTVALIGVVIAEYFFGNASIGLGGVILAASGNGKVGQAFVGVFIFALAGLAMTLVLRTFERRVSRWR